jgi:protoheme IX farnesyltransferase
VPPLVGYAAATGNLGLPALWLFLIVFLWTPPHFWALAILIKDNYAAAKVPMLPVVRGISATTKQVIVYTVVLIAVSSAPFAAGTVGPPYLFVALGLGGVFLWLALRLRRSATPRRASWLFHYSLLYLALLFVALAVDAAV